LVREEPVPAVAGASPYFLLSYPHTPYNGQGSDRDPDFWVSRFFEDLCRRLEELGAVPPRARIGVLDRDLWVADDWRTGLPEALATCRALVPLCSPRYFHSLHCGKEWSAFTDQGAGQAGPSAVPAIVPAMWSPMKPESLPAAARSVSVEYWGLASYAAFGLEGIIKLSRYRADYDEAVRRLARRIVAVAAVPTAPRRLVDYDSLSSPFVPGLGSMPGDRRLRITVVAPCKDDLPPGRGELHYGSTACDWNPYLSVSAESIGDYAANLARSMGFRPYVGDLRAHGADLLNGGPPAGPEVMIVDPWAVTRPECQGLLVRFNLPDKPWVQVVIPWNPGDGEVAAAEDRLRAALDFALRRKLERGRVTSAMAVDGVPTLDDFGTVLPWLIRAAEKQYFKYAQVFPPTGPAVGKPMLQGTAPAPSSLLEHAGG
jgi:FxsC-like protein